MSLTGSAFTFIDGMNMEENEEEIFQHLDLWYRNGAPPKQVTVF